MSDKITLAEIEEMLTGYKTKLVRFEENHSTVAEIYRKRIALCELALKGLKYDMIRYRLTNLEAHCQGPLSYGGGYLETLEGLDSFTKDEVIFGKN